MAVEMGNLEIVNMLVTAGANIETSKQYNYLLMIETGIHPSWWLRTMVI